MILHMLQTQEMNKKMARIMNGKVEWMWMEVKTYFKIPWHMISMIGKNSIDFREDSQSLARIIKLNHELSI
jgi:hypothetical protein